VKTTVHIPAALIAAAIFIAAAGSSAVCYFLSGSIGDFTVRSFVQTLIFWMALAEAFIVVLGLLGLLFVLQAKKRETAAAAEASSRIRDEARLVRGELEKAREDAAEAEAALEELRKLRNQERDSAARTQTAVRSLAERFPPMGEIEEPAAEALRLLAETRNRLETLPLFPPVTEPAEKTAGPELSPDPGGGWAAGLSRGTVYADELRRRLNEGTTLVNASKELTGGIAADVEKITELAGVISRISAQTNILSMNAAIESAHAGVLGAGFAVVAEEIKKLAESTASNAKQIQAEIKAITEKTRASVKAGEASSKTMGDLKTTAEALEELFSSLSVSGTQPPLTAAPEKPEKAAADGEEKTFREFSKAFTEQLEDIKAGYFLGHDRIRLELEAAIERVGRFRTALEPALHQEKPAPPEPPKPAEAQPVTPANPPLVPVVSSTAVTVKEPPRIVID
jgi:methyl-accepting chemotaxis protein